MDMNRPKVSELSRYEMIYMEGKSEKTSQVIEIAKLSLLAKLIRM